MQIFVYEAITIYDTGVHPGVNKIVFHRDCIGGFLNEDRFPDLATVVIGGGGNIWTPRELTICSMSLQYLDCKQSRLTNLSLQCPSLATLYCNRNYLKELVLDCPSLNQLDCSENVLERLELHCSSLKHLDCSENTLLEMNLHCPMLKNLFVWENPLENFNGLEYCSELRWITCDGRSRERAELLKIHIPELVIITRYRPNAG